MILLFNQEQKAFANEELPARGYMDAPANGFVSKGNFTISGWFLDGNGVKYIEVLVDGKVVGEAEYGNERLDVQRAHPEYQNPNSGYQYTLNSLSLTNGKHTLTVRETGSNGTQTTLSGRSIEVQNLASRGSIDSPRKGSTLSGGTTVRGWMLDPSGVEKVEVLVDGNLMGQAEYGASRLDVLNAYPDYQNANSGYQYTLNTANLTNGEHELTVRETGKNGSRKELKRSFTIEQLAMRGSLDAPAKNATIQGDQLVRGWFLDESGIAKVEVLVDGNFVGQAEYGSERLDVERAYPYYHTSNSGYQLMLDTKTLANGQHSLAVKATANNGNEKVINSLFTVQGLTAKGYLDSPRANATISGNTTVKGWFLDGSGVAKIEVLVDGKSMGEAQYGNSRLDVGRAYPQYQNDNSGYVFTLDTTPFPIGSHNLTVKETGVNGTVTTLTTSVTINNGNPYLLLDLKKPSNITATDIVNFFNLKSPNSPLKDYAQSFIDAQNKYGVNAQYLVAHAIWETGWGGSDLRTYKHNLYGYGAYDVCPFTCGYYFPSGPDSINKIAYQVRRDYLEPTGAYYSSNYGPTLAGMNEKYATDQNWKNGISSLMSIMKSFDYDYYASHSVLGASATPPPNYGRDIPEGQNYPTDTIINFDGGISAKTTAGVTLRSLPYVSSSTYIRTLSTGTAVTILGYNTDVYYDPSSTSYHAYRWYRVSVNGQIGWVNGQYLDVNPVK